MFVLEIRPGTREVVVGTRDELDSNLVTVSELNWLSETPRPGATVRTQLRYRAPAVEADRRTGDGGARSSLWSMPRVDQWRACLQA